MKYLKLLMILFIAAAGMYSCGKDNAIKSEGDNKNQDSTEFSSKVKHVVLISLDGSRPVFYMDKSWSAPNLQQLKNKGVYAAKGIESVFPSVTYPSHTAIITGAYPATTGIYYNKVFGNGIWYWYAKQIQCKTLWDAVKEAGMTSAAVFWPVTVGAPINYNFPVIRPGHGETGNRLTVKYPYIKPKGLLSDIEEKLGIKFSPSSLSTATGSFAQSQTIAIISKYIIKTYKPNFMAIHLVGIDHYEHRFGTEGPEIRQVVHVTDGLVGSILQTIKDAGIWKNTAIIITGDHGHTNTMATFAPNVYLAHHGLITDNGWKAKFHSSGGSAFLYLKNKNDQAILDSVVTILKDTPEYKEGDFRILDRNTLNKMGVNPNVALALAMKYGITVRNGITGKTLQIKDGSHSTHGYDPAYPSMHTTFIAIGAGIAEHKNITGMGIIDIAPIVAKLLGLKDFDAPDGKLFPGIVKKQ